MTHPSGETFRKYDVNDDGSVEKNELCTALQDRRCAAGAEASEQRLVLLDPATASSERAGATGAIFRGGAGFCVPERIRLGPKGWLRQGAGAVASGAVVSATGGGRFSFHRRKPSGPRWVAIAFRGRSS